MSVAGSDRVKVTQRKLLRVRAVKALSSTTSTIGKRLRTSIAANDEAKAARTGSSQPRAAVLEGPFTARIPGRQSRGAENPSGKRSPAGSSVVSSLLFGPAAAITTFDPLL